MIRFDVLTLFPNMFDAVMSESILKRAQAARKIDVKVHDIRSCATDKHKTCDDRPFGGGAGMVMKPEPIDKLCRKIFKTRPKKDFCFIYTSPAGKPFTQETARRLAAKKRIAILCGRYEGVDQRVIDLWGMEEYTIGDYVLTGGELPAMVMIDAVSRLIPGVLGNEASKSFESFEGNLLEYPQYTRPSSFRDLGVPPVLLTGNHLAIEKWRRAQSVERTAERRPDLSKGKQLS
jgi:tRNA (guanine37-N1)-methyltransferase